MSSKPTDVHPSNPGNNPSFQTLIDRAVSRRSLLKGGLSAAAFTLFAGGMLGGCSSNSSSDSDDSEATPERLLGFAAVVAGSGDAVVVPEGYATQVLFPWGAPVNSFSPAWEDDASQGWQEQERQVGDNHDGMAFFGFNAAGDGFGNRSDEGLLVMNHEYINPEYFYAPGNDADDWLLPFTFAKAKKAQAAHGVSVLHIRRASDGTWSHVASSPYNRRITGYTPMVLSGPAAGHALLQTEDDPDGSSVLGTLNNCANGRTPWGTYLTCEENFNGYFGATDEGYTPMLLS